MEWRQFYRARLAENLDPNGDIVPPWEKFPHYERYTIGWRMGSGEGWLCYWSVFLDELDPAFDTRLAYLKRHPAAPVNWAESVYDVLYPSQQLNDDEEEEDWVAVQRVADLLRLGVIASDAAYPIWRSQQEGVCWPWEFDTTPETKVRYGARELWFWSRQVVELRGSATWRMPEVPASWQPCAEPLATGQVPDLDLGRGLLSLAQMLAAGQVVPPWQLGLELSDFADTFEMDMGYVDAFRLWGMSAFDDREHLQRYLDATEVPQTWEDWIAEQFHLD